MNKKLLSMLLVLNMIFTMLPVSAMEEELDSTVETRGEIIEFAHLEETEKKVEVETSPEDLELPETLTSTVQTNPDTVAESVYNAEKLEDFGYVNYALASESSENIVTGNGYEYNTETKLLTITSDAGAKMGAHGEKKNTKLLYKILLLIIVEDAVASISDALFNDCPNLTSITIGKEFLVLECMF